MDRYFTNFNTKDFPSEKVDTIIVGAGIAGLSVANKLKELGSKFIILTKKNVGISNSFLAQGGLAAAIGKDDSPELHFKDTINAGKGLCIEKNVEILVEEGLERVVDLINNGLEFDKDERGYIKLTREAAHSKRRVLHVKDKTGKEIGKFLYKNLDNKYFETNFYLEEILTENNKFVGVIVSNKKEKKVIYAKSLVIASGGYSPLFKRNTSTYNIGGDVILKAFRAGCRLKDIEFIQFHPTALNLPHTPAYLITEAIRGEGAILIDEKGNRFTNELAPRDEVARANFEKEKEGSKVFLNLKPLIEKGINLEERFPTIYSLLKEYNLLDSIDKVPVSPAAHFSIGGIEANPSGKTNVEGIFAVGEASCTGVHGANRLASNSLLECITFGSKTAYGVYLYNMYEKIKEINISNKIRSNKVLTDNKKNEIIYKLKDLMWNKVGLIRDRESLTLALKTIENLIEDVQNHVSPAYILDILYLSKAVTLSALNREESRGVHYRQDFKSPREEFKKHSIIENKNFEIKLEVN